MPNESFDMGMPKDWYISTVRDRRWGTDCDQCRKSFERGDICWRKESGINQWGNKMYDELCFKCFWLKVRGKVAQSNIQHYRWEHAVFADFNEILQRRWRKLKHNDYKMIHNDLKHGGKKRKGASNMIEMLCARIGNFQDDNDILNALPYGSNHVKSGKSEELARYERQCKNCGYGGNFR